MTPRYRLDVGDRSTNVALAVCSCGWRGLASDRRAALERAAAHELVVHPDTTRAREALRKARQRDVRHARA